MRVVLFLLSHLVQQLLLPHAEDAAGLGRQPCMYKHVHVHMSKRSATPRVCVKPPTTVHTALVLHPGEGEAALLDAQLLGQRRHGRGGGVVLLVQHEAQVLCCV